MEPSDRTVCDWTSTVPVTRPTADNGATRRRAAIQLRPSGARTFRLLSSFDVAGEAQLASALRDAQEERVPGPVRIVARGALDARGSGHGSSAAARAEDLRTVRAGHPLGEAHVWTRGDPVVGRGLLVVAVRHTDGMVPRQVRPGSEVLRDDVRRVVDLAGRAG